jgi:predicted glycoside hydrolase/deacetylase ChbG (UPF0249 family)
MVGMTQRALIVNVDDIGISDRAVAAAVETISHGVAASGSVMMVCPGTPAALRLLAARRDVPVGVHLTLTRDLPEWAWSPLTRGRSIQDDGLLLTIQQRDQLLDQATLGDVEAEFRAQIELAIEARLQPTHLDWHCLADGGRDDFFDMTLGLAEEYRIGIRAWTDHGRRTLRGLGRLTQDQPFLDSFDVPVEGKTQHLIRRIRALPEGLSEWAMHPAAPSLTDAGSDIRASDREALLAPDVRLALEEEGITVLGYGDPVLRG